MSGNALPAPIIPRIVPGKHRFITHERIEKLISTTYWTECNVTGAERHLTATGCEGASVTITKYSVPHEQYEAVRPGFDRANPPFAEIIPFFKSAAGNNNSSSSSGDNKVTPVKVGDVFGPLNTLHWFKVVVRVDKITVKSPCPIDIRLKWCTGCEGLAYDEEGNEIGGVTGEGRDFLPCFFDVASTAAAASAPFIKTFYIEMQCSARMGDGVPTFIGPQNKQRTFELKKAEVMLVSRHLSQLRTDLDLLHQFATTEGVPDFLAEDALMAGNAACNAFRFGDYDSYGAALQATAAFWDKHSAAFSDKNAGAAACSNIRGSNGDPRDVIALLGNCHIDTCWLWTFRNTRMKIARSWSSQLLLINSPDRTTKDRNPYTFIASQAVQFQWLKEDYPKLFARVQAEATGSKRFVPLGATWVEADGNLPSGESFMRQFLLGQNFYKEHFGAVSDLFHLPDTFGYCAALVQIAAHCGCKYFVSQKLSWNLINKPQHTTFYWTGIDGTNKCLLAHFPPHDNYCCQASVKELVVMSAQAKQNRDMGRASAQICLYGEGDGGGGPFAQQVARADRLSTLTTTPMRIATDLTPSEVFQKLEQDDKERRLLTTVVGELYFEMHNGTYVTHRRLKKAVFEMEDLMRAAEASSALAELTAVFSTTPAAATNSGSKQKEYQHRTQELWKLWSDVLVSQFHDMLPGTSIEEAYIDTFAVLARAKKLALEIVEQAAGFVVAGAAVVNGSAVPLQLRHGATGERDIDWTLPNTASSINSNHSAVLPAFSICSSSAPSPAAVSAASPTSNNNNVIIKVQKDAASAIITVDTGAVTVKIEKDGRVASVVLADSTGTGVDHVFDGSSNANLQDQRRIGTEDATRWFQWCAYRSAALFWDAWDEFQYSQQAVLYTPKVVSEAAVEVEVAGLVHDTVVVVTTTLSFEHNVEIVQRLIFTAGSADIRLDAHIKNWASTPVSKNQLLKLQFGCNVVNHNCTYGTAFGAIARPTHFSNSFDLAKFEVPYDRWIDFSQPDMGVTFANNSGMRGVSVHSHTVGMSVLRAPREPDPTADVGDHRISVVVRPHQKSHYSASGAVDLAASLSLPIAVAGGGGGGGGAAAAAAAVAAVPKQLLATSSSLAVHRFASVGPSSRLHLTAVKLPEGYKRSTSSSSSSSSSVDVIVRLYETVGSNVAAGQVLSLAPDLFARVGGAAGEGSSPAVKATAWLTDGLEQRLSEVEGDLSPSENNRNGGSVASFKLPRFRAFEIMTVRIRVEKV